MKKIFKNYSIEFNSDSFTVSTNDFVWFNLPVSSAVDTSNPEYCNDNCETIFDDELNTDKDLSRLTLKYKIEENTITALYSTSSNLWREKLYTIFADKEGFNYSILLKGNGVVSKIRFFCGSKIEPKCSAKGYILPIATTKTKQDCTKSISTNGRIGLNYFAPPPYVFPFYSDKTNGWFGLGLFAKPGNYNFDTFIHKSNLHLVLPLNNLITVKDSWETPGIWGSYGNTSCDIIKAYCNWHYKTGLCKQHLDYSKCPKWWNGPIFCGWGEQQSLGNKYGKKASYFANQHEYTKMVDMLIEKKLDPKIIIIDSSWQKAKGKLVVDKAKWPNLREFTDRMHKQGKRVLLWIKSWDADGIPGKECINLLCNPVAVDPTNPYFIKRTKKSIHTLLSDDDDCFNCDGFKIDFINCIPKGNIKTYKGNIYGVELIKCWMTLIYDAAKAAKADSLINASMAHPYFSDVVDQVRLHDFDGSKLLSSVDVMSWRAAITNAAYSGITIDTDSGSTFNYDDFIQYVKCQPDLGVPDLYWLSKSYKVDFNDFDFDIIRREWQRYNSKLSNNKKYF